MSSASSVEMSSSISLENSNMASEPLVLQDDSVVPEASEDATNVITLRVMVLFTCTATDNYCNIVSSIIFMVLVVE